MLQLPTPNTIQEYKGFYISFNPSTHIYESITTALVVGEQMNHFYILNGDHREQYSKLGNDLEACLSYFSANKHLKNRYSESLT